MIKASWLSWLERRPVTAEVGGSSPPGVVCGILAQLGEHLPYKQRVTGSSPVGPIRRRGGTGRRAGLKILLWKHSTGSIPVAGSKVRREIQEFVFLLFLLYRRSYREFLYNRIHFLERKIQNEYFFLK